MQERELRIENWGLSIQIATFCLNPQLSAGKELCRSILTLHVSLMLFLPFHFRLSTFPLVVPIEMISTIRPNKLNSSLMGNFYLSPKDHTAIFVSDADGFSLNVHEGAPSV